jgi:hypothetical protein
MLHINQVGLQAGSSLLCFKEMPTSKASLDATRAVVYPLILLERTLSCVLYRCASFREASEVYDLSKLCWAGPKSAANEIHVIAVSVKTQRTKHPDAWGLEFSVEAGGEGLAC